ncbi:MAG: hypothetical protein RL758_404 [Pseudomonadota bacterium]|jgi:Protein of unknown function (DUF2889)
MSLTSATADSSVTREALHTRRIDFTGYRRSDGLFEVEGHLVDRKTHDFNLREGRSVPANEPVHDMGVRIVFDADMLIHEIDTITHAGPYPRCLDGGRALQSLIGQRMAGGWSREVRSRLSGARCCTHLMELLGPMATAAYQSLGFLHVIAPDVAGLDGRPRQIDSCYAYAADGELVLKRWPQFHRPQGQQA